MHNLYSTEGHAAILGMTGGGKSYTARGMAEALLRAGRRVCVLDPVGVWWGIRSGQDGKPGFPVAVLGGDHGDLPLHEDMAEPLAGLISAENMPVVLDTSDMSNAGRNRFLTAFLSDLYRHNRKALWLFLEEADEVAPQSPLPDSRALLNAADRIARKGRSRGFRLVMVSQRPAVLHKNLLTQITTMIVHRLTAPQDTKAVSDWFRANADAGVVDDMVSSLPALETGEAWVWKPGSSGPSLVRDFMPAITTHDSSRTPDADEVDTRPIGLADVDLTPLQAALKQEPIKLPPRTKRPTSNMPPAPDHSAILAEAERRGYESGYTAGFTEGGKARDQHWRDGLTALLSNDPAQPQRAVTAHDRGEVQQRAAGPKRPSPGGSAVNRAGQIADWLDTDPAIALPWTTLGPLVGLRPHGGHFNTIRKGLVDSGTVIETREGVTLAQPQNPRPAPLPGEIASRLRESWAAMLGEPQATIIGILHRDGPTQKTVIASELGLQPRGGHWNTIWKRLTSAGVVTLEGDGFARLAPTLSAP